jgi:hypothetical protein
MSAEHAGIARECVGMASMVIRASASLRAAPELPPAICRALARLELEALALQVAARRVELGIDESPDTGSGEVAW